jgi:hypothetical protein
VSDVERKRDVVHVSLSLAQVLNRVLPEWETRRKVRGWPYLVYLVPWLNIGEYNKVRRIHNRTTGTASVC